jgi:hypothetical protein
METNYTPGQILYIKPEYGEAYVSIITGTSPHHEGTMIHTCCDLTIHEYSENMYEGGITFARGNGTMLDVDTNFEEIRQAADCEKKMLFNALVRGFKEHNLGWDKHFTDSTYFDILDWLEWEFYFETSTDGMSQPKPIENTMYEIQDYIWEVLCKETGNYQEETVEPKMVSLDKACKVVSEMVQKFCPNLIRCGEDLKYWEDEFRKRLEE